MSAGLSLNSPVVWRMKSVTETSGIVTSGYGPRKIIVESQISNLKLLPQGRWATTWESTKVVATSGASVPHDADQMAAKLYIDVVQSSNSSLPFRIATA